ncbi:flagellar biosynthesis protein FlhF [Reinekea marinisedimentorum]|uniref:Flagellar biosynthesis protein FlhF n=1 Tax=Reinekea marinisedimentorum TaxID=230495 RepID=A0A4R3I4W1_9GAMM|nr:flagellar biosynthesis protein FlhF [Reinekea marinisedimentorum]TCS39951.1 flagellar biosynthesis protein FlhF [Reinekea marinisedimentorum]
MKIKRFTAGNMQAGLKTISETLGPEAVILSNRRLANGLEIVAGVDEAEYELFLESQPVDQQESDIIKAEPDQPAPQLDSETMKQLFAAMSDKNTQAFEPHATVKQPYLNTRITADVRSMTKAAVQAPKQPAKKPAPAAATPPVEQAAVQSDISMLRREIDGLKDMLKAQAEQLREPAVVTDISPQYERLEARLHTLGFSGRLTRKLLAQFDKEEAIETNWRKTMSRLASAIPTPIYEPFDNGGVFALTGPTGAGKSTTIAKLAAHAVRDHGAESVALVSLDWFQVGGQEILNSVADILGIEFHALTEHDSLQETLAQLSEKRLVLIDTSGSRPAIAHWNNLMEDTALRNQLRTLLVLPSNMHSASVNQFIGLHARKAFAAVVLSKLDESASFGSVIEPVLRNSWPVWFCTTGQNIPQDIEKADARALISRLLDALKKEPAQLATAG